MQLTIEIVIGMLLAVGFLLLVTLTGSYSKEVLNLAIALSVTALIYVGFGLFSGLRTWVFIELLGVLIYSVFAWLGLRKSAWFLALGWALHPVWDAGLHGYATPFVPHWYIGGCTGFDLLVAGYIGFLKIRK
jgi:hypothetical protein